MNSLRVAVIAAILVAVVFGGISYADQGRQGRHGDRQDKCQTELKDLKDAATALQQSNPDLAKGLNELVAENEKKMQEMADMKAKCEARTKLLRDSAASLQKANPELAETLWDMSKPRPMRKMGYGQKECPMRMMGPREE
ncbi:MAG: hypothetical protein WC592_03205 [Candidatus Omnitrophota bacterium]|nr:hypothetical protein [Candidatus Omnitrophota bacterium]